MDQRQVPEDFRDFIKCLNKNEDQYLLIGGRAVGIYGNPRATKDIDFLVAYDDENLIKPSLRSRTSEHLPSTLNSSRKKGMCIEWAAPPFKLLLSIMPTACKR